MAWKPVYATDVQLTDFVRIPDDADDAQVALALATSSRTIDNRCRRQFGKTDAPVTRTYSLDGWCGTVCVSIDDLMDVTGLVVTLDGDPVTDYEFGPLNAAADGMPWTDITLSGVVGGWEPQRLAITADVWGWAEVPDTIVEATLLQASRVLSRRDSPYGVAGSPSSGGEMRLLAKLDPDVLVAVEPYRRRARPQ